MQGMREAMGISREGQRVLWDRNWKALASLKAELPSFPLCHGTDCREGTHLPLAHMVATSSHLRALPPRRESTLAQTAGLAWESGG